MRGDGDDSRGPDHARLARRHPFLRINSGSGRRTASLSPALTPALTAACSRPRRTISIACSSNFEPFRLVDDGTAVLLEDRFGRHERHVRHAVGGDARGRRHAGTDARIALVEDEAEIEIADRRPARREVDAREHGDQIDLRGEILAGDRLDLHRRGLADLQAAAIGLVEARLEMDRRQVRQLEDRRRRPTRDPLRGTRRRRRRTVRRSAGSGGC